MNFFRRFDLAALRERVTDLFSNLPRPGTRTTGPRAGLKDQLKSLTRRGTATPIVEGPQPARTAFDLFEGDFAIARATRQATIAAALIFVVVIVLLIGTSLSTYVSRTQTAAAITQERTTVNQLNSSIAKTTPGGQLPEVIISHHTSRVGVVNAIEQGSVNLGLVLGDLEQLAPAKSNIISLVIGTAATPSTSTATSTNTTPFTVTFTLPTVSDTTSVENAIQALSIVAPKSVSFQGVVGTGPLGGGESTTSVTFNGSLTSTADVNRAGDL